MIDNVEEKVLPVETVDFEFVQPPDNYDHTKNPANPEVRILIAPWHNVLVKYGKIWLERPPDGLNTPVLAFEYDIIDEAGLDRESLINDATLKQFIGDIIVVTIEDMLEHGERRDLAAEESNENRNNGIEIPPV
jgi:hypothetical protein